MNSNLISHDYLLQEQCDDAFITDSEMRNMNDFISKLYHC